MSSAANRAYFRGLTMAAHAAAALAREALAAGDIQKWATRSQHAAQLTEDARIIRGDIEALLDRTERVLEAGYLNERMQARSLDSARAELEREALEAASEALNARWRRA